jgi:hypothetical protein
VYAVQRRGDRKSMSQNMNLESFFFWSRAPTDRKNERSRKFWQVVTVG